jgi:hypothetical protein
MGPWSKRSVTWSYRFESAGGGTLVTESFALGAWWPLRLYALVAGRSRTRTNVNNMRATLERIKTVAETPEEPDSPPRRGFT